MSCWRDPMRLVLSLFSKDGSVARGGGRSEPRAADGKSNHELNQHRGELRLDVRESTTSSSGRSQHSEQFRSLLKDAYYRLLPRIRKMAGDVSQLAINHWMINWIRELQQVGEAARSSSSERAAAGDDGARVDENDSPNRVWMQLYEYALKIIPVEFALIISFYLHAPYLPGDVLVVIAFAVCLIAFLSDSISSCVLITYAELVTSVFFFLFTFVSAVCMILVPYLLLVAFNRVSVSTYAIAPLTLPLAAAWIHHLIASSSSGAPADTQLVHVFGFSSAINSIAAGGGLAGTMLGYTLATTDTATGMPVTSLGFLLFFTIALAIYLMLVTTVGLPVLARHAVFLCYILILLLVVCAVIAAVELLGVLWACAAFAMEAVDAIAHVAFVLYHGGVPAVVKDNDVDVDDVAGKIRMGQRLLSTALTAVVFAVLIQHHSRGVAAKASGCLGLSATLSTLLYLAAFMCCLNWMTLSYVEPATGRSTSRSLWAWVWSALKFMRFLVVVLAFVDMVYNFTGLFMSAFQWPHHAP